MPVGVQCPISSSLGEFPSCWVWLWCPGLLLVLVSIALPFAFHTWCFPFAPICHWISIVFLLYSRRIAIHSVDPSLTHFLGEFPGSGTDVVVPEAEQRCAWSRKLDPNFCPGWGRTSDLATRLPRTHHFSRLLRHAGRYSRTSLTPNPQRYINKANNFHIFNFKLTQTQIELQTQ